MAQWTIKHPDGTQSVVGGIVGSLVPFAGATPPAHMLLCNGAAVSRETYAELFAAIGTTWGAGDGSTTFNLPDFSGGQFIRGTGGNAGALGTAQAEGLPNIAGSFNTMYISDVYNSGPFSNDWVVNTLTHGTGTTGWKYFNQTFNASAANSIYGKSSHVTPINNAATICIVYE